MASRKTLRRWLSRPESASSRMVMPGLVGQAADGVHEVEVLDGPDEADGVALGLAPEAVVEALLGVDAERRGLLAVERAQADPAAALTLERGVLPDEGHDVRCRPDPGDVLIGDPHRGRRYRVAGRSSVRPPAPRQLRWPAYRLALALAPWPWRLAGFDAGFGPAWPALVWPARTAWAAASRAMGTRKGEQLT